MKVSYNWLKELVDINGISQEQFLRDLSLYSVEIDGVESLAKVSSLVVGHVLEKEKHPDADKLSVCKVDVKTTVLQIVCGAPNCEAGKKVIVALPGTKLPGGEIKVSKIRGVESSGMLCSLQELGVDNKYIPAEYAHGIYFLDDNTEVGTDAIKALCFDDIAIELGLTPNRMDLLSMVGVAQDVSAIYNRPLLPINFTLNETEKLASEEIALELKTRACYTYYARVIKDVTIKESPQFIKTRLMAAGIRSINNVVDISNYILMLFGQPLHTFDQDKLGNKIIVRRARENEELITLDEQPRKLKTKDIVITDNTTPEGRIVALGGVMGGLTTEVTPETKNIVLEAAVFRPGTIRRTSRRLNLRSESSMRYERGVDLNRTLLAMNYACYLMEKYADGKVLKGYVHEGLEHIANREYKLSVQKVNNYLGITLTASRIIEILTGLGFEASLIDDDLLFVSVPNRRMDITINADLIEEIGRINGYEHLKETIPSMNVLGALTKNQHYRRLAKNVLATLGCNETITYSLINPAQNEAFRLLVPSEAGPVELSNPLTEEHSVARMSLIPSLLEIIKYNKARKMKDCKFFELSKIYYKIGADYLEENHLAGAFSGVFARNVHTNYLEKVDFFLVKGLLEELFKKYGLKVDYKLLTSQCAEFHPTRTAELYLNGELIGYLGEVHPKFAKDNDLDETYVFELRIDQIIEQIPEEFNFKQIAKVPVVERDLALVMDLNQSVGEVIQAIYSSDKQAITDVTVFDEYIGEKLGENLKSIAVRITIESMTTLTEEEISAKIKRILKSLEYRYHITLRE